MSKCTLLTQFMVETIRIVEKSLPRWRLQAAHRKHSRWNILVFALMTKSFLVKTVWQEEHLAPYSLQKTKSFKHCPKQIFQNTAQINH